MSLSWPQTLKVNDLDEIFTIKGLNKDVTGIRYSLDWTINKFLDCTPGINKGVRSATFLLGENNQHEAYLIVYPNGVDNEHNAMVSLFFQFTTLCSMNLRGFHAKAKLTLLAYRTSDSVSKEVVMESETFCPDLGWGFSDFVPWTTLKSNASLYLPNGALTIRCKITLVTDSTGVNATVPQSYLLNSIANLYKTSEFADVTFVIGGMKLLAHKAILGARSVVFRTMFQIDMTEGNTSVVNIADASVELFDNLLLFIYTGQVPLLNSLGEELLGMSEKYALHDLKVICEESLVGQLTVENAAHVFVVADGVGATLLKQQVVMFIRQHRQQVKATEGWKCAKQECPRVLAEAFLEC